MSEEAGGTPKHKNWPRRIAVWIIGFAVSLAIGWVIERVTDSEFLESAKQAQADWITAVSQTSPIAVATTYWDELQTAFTGGPTNPNYFDPNTGKGNGIASPIVALVVTAMRFFYSGGIAALVQLGLSALAIAVYNFRRSKGETILFEAWPTNILLGPVAIVVIASVFGFVLQGVMLGALYALSWITGLAAAAAGATGIVGFCWYCATKLGEKTIEHVATPHA